MNLTNHSLRAGTESACAAVGSHLALRFSPRRFSGVEFWEGALGVGDAMAISPKGAK